MKTFNHFNTEGFTDDELVHLNSQFDKRCAKVHAKHGDQKWSNIFMEFLDNIVGEGNL